MRKIKLQNVNLWLISAGFFLSIFSVYLLKGFKDSRISFQAPDVVIRGMGRVTFVAGDVYYRNKQKKFSYWKQLVVGNTLETGHEVKTAKDGRVDLAFSHKSFLTLEPKSKLEIRKFSVDRLNINLKNGSFYGCFKKLFDEQSVKVTTKTVVAELMGTDKMGHQLENSQLQFKVNKQKGITEIKSLTGLTRLSRKRSPNRVIFLSSKDKVSISKKNTKFKVKKLTDKETQSLKKAIQSIYRDEVLLITNKIRFKEGKFELSIDSYTELNKIAEMLKQSQTKILIKGHADSFGDMGHNQELSWKRAMAIKEYLVGQGMNKDMLEVKAYGERDSLASNQTNRGRHLNRRVEFSVIK